MSLLTSIFQPIAASAKKDIAQQVTALKHPELVEFLVTSDAAQPLFRTILSCLSFKDAFSTGRLLIVLNTLTPILSKSPAFDELLGKQVLMGALEVVHDGYKKECHSEAILLITDIYATLGLRQCSFPRETFAVLPGMTKEKLEEFERQILAPSQDLTTSGSHTSKERLAATKALLSSITGLELSRLFTKKTPSFVLDLAQKQLLLSKPESDSQRCNLLMDQGESSANLEGLFDE